MSKEGIGGLCFIQTRRLAYAACLTGKWFYGMIAMIPFTDALSDMGYKIHYSWFDIWYWVSQKINSVTITQTSRKRAESQEVLKSSPKPYTRLNTRLRKKCLLENVKLLFIRHCLLFQAMLFYNLCAKQAAVWTITGGGETLRLRESRKYWRACRWSHWRCRLRVTAAQPRSHDNNIPWW